MKNLRLAGIVKDSIVDGPGIRLAIFAQGCKHYCPHCHNPHTHDPAGGQEASLDELIKLMDELIQGKYISGVTFTGGEPLLQGDAFLELGKKVKERGLHLIIYSGYTFEEIMEQSKENQSAIELLAQADWLVDGPYRHDLRESDLAFRGSANQRILDLKASLTTETAVEVERYKRWL